MKKAGAGFILLLAALLFSAVPVMAEEAHEHHHDVAANATPQLPIHILAKTIWPLRAKEVVDCYLYLWTDQGPVRMDDLDTTHTKKIHLYLLTPDFKEFYHAHPIPTGAEGEYRFSFQPGSTVPTRVWAEFSINGQHQVLMTDLDGKTADIQPPQGSQLVQSETGDIVFTIHFPGELHVGVPAEGTIYAVHKATNMPFRELEPLLGAFAHITAFAPDFKTLYHTHPVGPEITDASAMGGPSVKFQLTPEVPGMMKIFAQFKTRGYDLLVPFIVRVVPAKRPILHKEPDDEEIPPPPPDAEPNAEK